MEKEKKEVGAWWVWILTLLVLSVIVFSIIGYVGFFGRTVVERKVFENSFQYSESRKAEVATFEAQLTEIERKLNNSDLDQNTKRNLEAQASGLRVQLSVARAK